MSLHNVKLELKALTSVCLGYQMKGSRDTGYSPKPASLLRVVTPLTWFHIYKEKIKARQVISAQNTRILNI